MTQRSLGSSGIGVSAVGVGCNAFGSRIDAEQTKAVVDACFDHGVTFFDTADTYGLGASEELLGKALRGRRNEVVVASKFGMDMQGVNGDDGGARGRPEYVHRACEASLCRLGTDVIDLYQLHTPDPSTPIAETLGAMDELVRAGKVRAIGCSNFQAWQVVDAAWTARTLDLASFATAQNEYSLYNRSAEVELTPACAAFGIGILPYFPLAYGLLTGKYRRDQRPAEGTRLAAQPHRYDAADWDALEALETFARERRITILELAIGGLAAQPQVSSVIAGATRPEQIAANAAAGRWQPTEDDLVALAELGRPRHSYTTYAP